MSLIYHVYPKIQQLLITFIGKYNIKEKVILINFPRLEEINKQTKDNQDLTPAEVLQTKPKRKSSSSKGIL